MANFNTTRYGTLTDAKLSKPTDDMISAARGVALLFTRWCSRSSGQASCDDNRVSLVHRNAR